MTRIIPPYLQPGDEVAILSPASFPPTENWKQGVEVLENWGFAYAWRLTTCLGISA